MRRRYFLGAGAAALGAGYAPAWADIAGHEPLCLTAGNRPDNSTFLIGLSLGGRVLFSHPLPGRGHAAAVHPDRAEAVAFARRPGRFGLVIDCATGREIARLETPEETHFYGHGAFTADGRFLFTTENAFDIPDGRIGIWDAEKRYTRVGDVASGGLGPHEIIRLASGAFAVANGGIRTHPAFPRAKLNLPDMVTGLAVLSESGELLEDWPFDGSQPAAQQGALRSAISPRTRAAASSPRCNGRATRGSRCRSPPVSRRAARRRFSTTQTPPPSCIMRARLRWPKAAPSR